MAFAKHAGSISTPVIVAKYAAQIQTDSATFESHHRSEFTDRILPDHSRPA
jgi:hypothetical protein